MQERFDLALANGRVIDPARGVSGEETVAVRDERVVAVGPDVDPDAATTIVDCSGRIVVPGLIDLHVHVYDGVGPLGLPADACCLARGVTTAVDAGTAGAETFAGFRPAIESSQTRILPLLNISTIGQATGFGELQEPSYASVENAVATIEAHRDLIAGLKVRLTKTWVVSKRAGMEPLARTRAAADAVGLPMMVHPQDSWCGSIEEVLASMKRGDILTHCFHGCDDGILDEAGIVRPGVWEALERGVVFDVGHGGGSFNWNVAERAMDQGFVPTTISSDLHRGNVAGPVFDLTTTMSKLLCLGLSLADVIERVTAVPARVLGRSEEIGSLGPGACADVTVLDVQEGEFELWDGEGQSRLGSSMIVPVAAVRGGQLVTQAGELAGARAD